MKVWEWWRAGSEKTCSQNSFLSASDVTVMHKTCCVQRVGCVKKIQCSRWVELHVWKSLAVQGCYPCANLICRARPELLFIADGAEPALLLRICTSSGFPRTPLTVQSPLFLQASFAFWSCILVVSYASRSSFTFQCHVILTGASVSLSLVAASTETWRSSLMFLHDFLHRWLILQNIFNLQISVQEF